MKLKRYKKIQRHMSFFEKNFLFRTPFQILLDGTFAQAALMTKVNIQDQLPKYLNGQIKLLTTPCIVIETENIGSKVFGALQILKQFPTHKCSHNRIPVPADECILSMVSNINPNRYIIATQDSTLRERLRLIPGVALIYLHRNAPTFEKPSDKSIEYAQEQNLKKIEILDYQKDILNAMKKSILGDDDDDENNNNIKKKGTIKRKRAGPNPLSCKKSKKKKSQQRGRAPGAGASTGCNELSTVKKRKRIKIKTPRHVKVERQQQHHQRPSTSNQQHEDQSRHVDDT